MLAVAVALASVLVRTPEPARAAPAKRVLVLGFDGADSQVTERLLEAGKLPNLAKLRDSGSYSSLMPTNPAEISPA